MIQTFIEQSKDPQVIVQEFLPPLLEAVLGDYQASVADARDHGVLSLMTVIVNKLQVGAILSSCVGD